MNPKTDHGALPLPRRVGQRFFTAFEHFIHIEAASGIVLLLAAAAALIWANSPFSHSYHVFWETPIVLGVGSFMWTQSLHFWINDVLMTVFFLVVGFEIRREIHEGSLSDLRQAVLPLAAAVGGVAVPALIYVAINRDPALQHGWAVPTATDIAFAVGVLALLGRSIPGTVRVFLLTLAIVDDIIAVMIIAIFYSSGLDYTGFAVSALGIVATIGMQRFGVGSAFAYVLPGAVVWGGLLMSGAHPTLAGVILGLLTPVVPMHNRKHALLVLEDSTQNISANADVTGHDIDQLAQPLRKLRLAQRELLAPVVRVQWALHPWVAFVIMPLFALANAGVSFGGVDLGGAGLLTVVGGVAMALVIGKPVGVFVVSWVMVKLGLCRLPEGMTWQSVALIGLLAGIGFTMSIFIAMLAFPEEQTLAAAKVGVLAGSLIAGISGFTLGKLMTRRKPVAAAA